MDSNLTTIVFDKGGLDIATDLGLHFINTIIPPQYRAIAFIIFASILVLISIILMKNKKISLISIVLMLAVIGGSLITYFPNLKSLSTDNPLKITEFSANKSKYNKNSKDISFNLISNKSGYCYIFTRKYGSHKWMMIFPNKYRSDYNINANRVKKIGNFKIAKYDGDEIVRVVVTTKDIIDYNKTFTKDSTTFAGVEDKVLNKELAYNPDSKTKQQTNKVNDIEIAIKQIKLKVDANSQDSIYLNIKNTKYRAGEEIDLDIRTSSRGYVKIYDILLDTLKVSFIKDEEVKSGLNKKFINAPNEKGRHLILAVFNKERFNLKPSQIEIKEQIQKGGNIFVIKFKTKNYLYDTQEYKVW